MHTATRKIIEEFRSTFYDIYDEDSASEYVDKIFNTFGKLIKNINEHIYEKELFGSLCSDLHDSLQQFFESYPVFPVKISQFDFLCGSRHFKPEDDSSGKTIAFIYFSGLRELFFQKEVTSDEIELFFNIIAKSISSKSINNDLISFLWNEQFSSISFIIEEEIIHFDTFKVNELNHMHDFSVKGSYLQDFDEELILNLLKTFPDSYKNSLDFKEITAGYDDESIVNAFINNFYSAVIKLKNSFDKIEIINTAINMWKKMLLSGSFRDSMLLLTTVLTIGKKLKSTDSIVYEALKKEIN